jgi:hypothetical protein
VAGLTANVRMQVCNPDVGRREFCRLWLQPRHGHIENERLQPLKYRF